MRGEHFYGSVARKKSTPVRSFERRGVPAAGVISRLCVGQGYGFIRLGDDEDVYFIQGTSINELAIGDVVACERLDDKVSGARALRVRRQAYES
jgi:cold shock CspA family protein